MGMERGNGLIPSQSQVGNLHDGRIQMSNPISQAEYKVDERCPMCEDTDVEGGSVDINNGHAFQNITCLSCGASWTDEYKLHRYSNLHDDEVNEIEVPNEE